MNAPQELSRVAQLLSVAEAMTADLNLRLPDNGNQCATSKDVPLHQVVRLRVTPTCINSIYRKGAQ